MPPAIPLASVRWALREPETLAASIQVFRANHQAAAVRVIEAKQQALVVAPCLLLPEIAALHPSQRRRAAGGAASASTARSSNGHLMTCGS